LSPIERTEKRENGGFQKKTITNAFSPIRAKQSKNGTGEQTMNRDKQIEEMAKVIKSSLDGLGSGNFNFTGEEISAMFAKALYNADYRKSTDVAREIFDKVKGTLKMYGATSALFLVERVEKKYESEGAE
jgi:hypothetical protein